MRKEIKIDHIYKVTDSKSDEVVISLCIADGKVYFKDLRIISIRDNNSGEGYVGFEWYFREYNERYTPELLGHINDLPEYLI